jgi:hypothetical protein
MYLDDKNYGQYVSDSIVNEPLLKAAEAKPRLDLLSGIALDEMGMVLRMGSEKYADNLWRTNPTVWSARIGSVLRHVFAFNDGEDNDPESGHSHLTHAMVQLMFLLEYTHTNTSKDDRWNV